MFRLKSIFLSLSLLTISLFITTSAFAAEPSTSMQTIIVKAGVTPSTKGAAESFTGNVRVDSLFRPNESSQVSGSSVTFEPGARTAWHTHPLGQRLIITSGVGLVQEWGGPIIEVRAGDVVWFPPGVKHWHGAAPKSSMTHIALTGVLSGKSTDWLEKVSDEQYAL